MPGFEIAGYQRPMLEAFSTRRRELLDYMQDRGWENTPARTQQAALYIQGSRHLLAPQGWRVEGNKRIVGLGGRDALFLVKKDAWTTDFAISAIKCDAP